MKHYPEIQSTVIPDLEVYVFEKLDGSNIRAEWSPKRGFYKFGTRKRLFGEDDPMFGEAISLIKEKEKHLVGVFKQLGFESAVAYFEFLGEGSFAGFHLKEPHRVVLIDVEGFKQGFVAPSQFVGLFSDLTDTAKLIHYGKITPVIEEQIRAGRFPGASFEGVVCKASPEKKWSLPVTFKVKNQAWIEAVKAKHGSRADLRDIL